MPTNNYVSKVSSVMEWNRRRKKKPPKDLSIPKAVRGRGWAWSKAQIIDKHGFYGGGEIGLTGPQTLQASVRFFGGKQGFPKCTPCLTALLCEMNRQFTEIENLKKATGDLKSEHWKMRRDLWNINRALTGTRIRMTKRFSFDGVDVMLEDGIVLGGMNTVCYIGVGKKASTAQQAGGNDSLHMKEELEEIKGRMTVLEFELLDFNDRLESMKQTYFSESKNFCRTAANRKSNYENLLNQLQKKGATVHELWIQIWELKNLADAINDTNDFSRNIAKSDCIPRSVAGKYGGIDDQSMDTFCTGKHLLQPSAGELHVGFKGGAADIIVAVCAMLLFTAAILTAAIVIRDTLTICGGALNRAMNAMSQKDEDDDDYVDISHFFPPPQ